MLRYEQRKFMNRRMLKISELLTQELNAWLAREFCEQYGIITVHDLEVSKDLSWAKAWLGIIDQTKSIKITNAIESKQWQFRKLLGKKLKLKTIPKIQFLLDESQEKIIKVEKILHQIKSQI